MAVGQIWSQRMSGTLYGLGVGPGDPELLTLKALRILQRVKVIAWPAPDDGVSFARSIVAQYISADQLEIPIIVPMKVERYPAKEVYDKAAKRIASHLESGSDVAVLCEGDPFFYGSFMYLFERLEGAYNCEIVPGISSMMAASAAIKQPLAARNDVLSIIPAPLADEEITARLSVSSAVAFIKVGRHFKRVRALIEKAGLLESAAYVERASLDNQRMMPLASVADDAVPYFSMILIYKGAEEWIENLVLGDGKNESS
jgi:precorrin-2/cobalt-factor-2 C20-methyltransferase